MEEKVEKKEGISVKEIFKLLLKKIKLLLLVLLAGIVVGAGFGILTNFNEKYYGTSIEFYVNPVPTEDEVDSDSYFAVNGTYTINVMDGLKYLLSSESFAERLLMDKDGLPKQVFRSDERAQEIDSKIAAALTPIDNEEKTTKAVELADEERTEAKKDYNLKNVKWAEYQSEIRFAKDMGDPNNVIPALTVLLEQAKELKDEAKAVWDLKEDAYELALEDQKDAKKTAEDARNEVYKIYRQTSRYKTLIKTIRSSVSFSWYKPEEKDNLESIARSFIYVDIKVDGDEQLAKELYQQICDILPDYVSNAMPKPSGYKGTACRQITRLDEVKNLNAGQTLSATVKYGILIGFISVAVASVVVIIIDQKRKNKQKA